MRTIKFRIWDKVNKKFIKDIDFCDIPHVLGDLSYDGGTDLYENYVIQQYTGLKDRKDIEIYEGDIVYLEYFRIPTIDTKNLYVIEFKRGSFVLTPKILDAEKKLKVLAGVDKDGIEIWKRVMPDMGDSVYDYGIIRHLGNIFENPELLINEN